MIFYKTAASGNDFLHVALGDYQDLAAQTGLSRGDLARELCRRHSGPGADGVVYYRFRDKNEAPSGGVDFNIFNRDGSEAELSGNGMAGLTALLFYLEEAGPDARRVVLHTKVGQRTHRLLQRQGQRFLLDIEIGAADFGAAAFFPFLEPGTLSYTFGGLTFYPVSVGNPHAVVLLDEDMDDETLARMGRKLEQADIFPRHTNVDFVIRTEEHFRVFFYERGVGPTLASSTGSAAVFAVLRKIGEISDSLTLPSGTKISGKSTISIESSVEIVYKGIYLKHTNIK
jgi:diaminopimelate epimerase